MKINKIFFMIVLSLVLWACSRNNNNQATANHARLQISLTDDPGDYRSVIIDVQDVQINLTNDTAHGWQSLDNVRRGQYDLLTLVNDQDTILADANIPAGKVHQIRLILGLDNYIVFNNNQIENLKTPSAQQSGLKLNIQQNINAGILYKLVLDFDVARSIVETGGNKYILKPVIRTMFESIGGSIKGWVKPDSITTSVLAINGLDTLASTYTDTNGGYLIRGLQAGTYDLRFLPAGNLFADTTRTGINVITNTVTIVDTMNFQ